MKIDLVYNSHTDILYDILKLRRAYSDKYLSIMKNNLLSGVEISKKEIYRMAFGVYLDEVDFEKRPFSKFKKDILEELGIVEK